MMLMSEAIRLGIPAVHDDRLSFLWEYKGTCSGCAIGAALYSVGVRPYELSGSGWVKKAEAVWPYLAHSLGDGFILSGEISHRHFTGTSREELADWIEGWEVQLGQAEIPYDVKEVSYDADESSDKVGGHAETSIVYSGTTR